MTTTPPDNAGLAERYRKKPIVVDAFRLGHDAMPDWFCDARSEGRISTHNFDERWRGGPDYALIETLEGQMKAEFGDWIIKGVVGEIYPCKPDIFEATYESAAALRPSVWMDISTAPKDGTAILVCVTYSLGGDEWQTDMWVDWRQGPYEWPMWKERVDIPAPPTHWQPLPSAPTPPKAPTP